jgi:hypothetical protein
VSVLLIQRHVLTVKFLTMMGFQEPQEVAHKEEAARQ